MKTLKKRLASTAVVWMVGVALVPVLTIAYATGSRQIIYYYCDPDFTQLVGGEGSGRGSSCGGSWQFGVTGPWRAIYDTVDCADLAIMPDVVTRASCEAWVDGQWRPVNCPSSVCEGWSGCEFW